MPEIVGPGKSILTEVQPGTGATDLGKAEDAVHASGDVGVEVLAVRRDAAASSGANGDYVTINSDATGRLWTHVGIVDEVVPGVAATDLGKAEDAVHADGDTGVMFLGVANINNGTNLSGAEGDY